MCDVFPVVTYAPGIIALDSHDYSVKIIEAQKLIQRLKIRRLESGGSGCW